MKQKDKNTPLERFCRALEISPDTIPKSFVVELHGQSLLKIQGNGKILLYTDNEIKIALSGNTILCVRGNSLSCSSYNRGTIGIEGKIFSVAFESDKEVK